MPLRIRKPSQAAPRAPGAFTLLEIMIVVGIAGLIMTISIPFVKRTFGRDAVYRAVKTVEDACHNARAMAIFGNSATEMIIRPKDKSVSVSASSANSSFAASRRPASEDSDTRPASRRPPPIAIKPFSGHLDDNVSIELLDVNFNEFKTEEEARVRFHPNGTSDEFTIVLRIGPTVWRKISLDLVTGLPRLEVMR